MACSVPAPRAAVLYIYYIMGYLLSSQFHGPAGAGHENRPLTPRAQRLRGGLCAGL